MKVVIWMVEKREMGKIELVLDLNSGAFLVLPCWEDLIANQIIKPLGAKLPKWQFWLISYLDSQWPSISLIYHREKKFQRKEWWDLGSK